MRVKDVSVLLMFSCRTHVSSRTYRSSNVHADICRLSSNPTLPIHFHRHPLIELPYRHASDIRISLSPECTENEEHQRTPFPIPFISSRNVCRGRVVVSVRLHMVFPGSVGYLRTASLFLAVRVHEVCRNANVTPCTARAVNAWPSHCRSAAA